MSDFQFTTAVAFIIFNRPDTTELVFAEIAKAKPPKLLVVGDGPRSDRLGEAERVAAARSIIKRVDWDCEVLTNFSEVNLGCRRRVSSGLNWVFEQVEEAIILEDDCLPDPTFFRFCQEMLVLYRHDMRIGSIACTNTQFGHLSINSSYYFSKYSLIWGWASWRDRWVGSYDVSMGKWPRIRDEGWLAGLVGNTDEVEYWQNIFDLTYRGEIDTWDYQWIFINWLTGRMSIVPTVNLISNIGFGEFATHTQNNKSHLANMTKSQLSFPITHPPGVFKDTLADQFTDLVYMRGITPNRARQMIRVKMRNQFCINIYKEMIRKIHIIIRRLLNTCAKIGQVLFRA